MADTQIIDMSISIPALDAAIDRCKYGAVIESMKDYDARKKLGNKIEIKSSRCLVCDSADFKDVNCPYYTPEKRVRTNSSKGKTSVFDTNIFYLEKRA